MKSIYYIQIILDGSSSTSSSTSTFINKENAQNFFKSICEKFPKRNELNNNQECNIWFFEETFLDFKANKSVLGFYQN